MPASQDVTSPPNQINGKTMIVSSTPMRCGVFEGNEDGSEPLPELFVSCDS